MELNLQLLQHIFETPSPTGYTEKIVKFLRDYVTSLGYESFINKKGNLIVTVKGKENYNIGLSAHTDTLGLMVRSIMSNGHLKFTRIGGIQLPTVDGEYCQIITRSGKTYTGTVLSKSPSSHVYKNAATLTRDEDGMYIRLDELVHTKDDTVNLGIENGDFIAIDPKFEITSNGFIKTRFLDDKASVFILLTLLEKIKKEKITPRANLTVIFTTYEEVGHGCSNVPEIDELLAVDMGCIGEDLSTTEEKVSICAKDGSGPYDYSMTSKLISLAKEHKLNYAVYIYPFYSSDASAALRGGNDLKCALIGAGIHASHGMERTHISGLEETLKLLMLYIQN